MQFCKLGQYLYNLMPIACLVHWNDIFIISLAPKCPFQSIPVIFLSIPVHSGSIPVDSCPFPWIPVPFLQIPVEQIYSCRNQWVVFAGPVCWTRKKTEIELNPEKDQTTGCGCTNSEFFQLPVATFVKKSKNRKKKTGLDRLQPVFHPIMCWTLLMHIFP